MKAKTADCGGCLERAWYSTARWVWLLLPLTWLFRLVALLRRRYYLSKTPPPLSAPVIVVGNLSVGGTGKTPLLISLVEHLKTRGYKPGVISRGYGGKSVYPCLVTPQSLAAEVGDEPLLIANHSPANHSPANHSPANQCPVVVDPDRYRAACYLLEQTDCDVILSDDGLQHYRLPRDIEIVVVDGNRSFGNGFCLPAGPLREPLQRLAEVDFVVVNGKVVGDTFATDIGGREYYGFQLQPRTFRNLADGRQVSLEALPRGEVHAVAGIGNPRRFADTLQTLGFTPQLHAYPDHHVFSGEELVFTDGLPVIITAKDAVKCQGLDNEQVWILDVVAEPEAAFYKALESKVQEKALEKVLGKQTHERN